MLDSLRNAARSWVAKLLLGLLVLSFAVWGISGQIFGGLGRDVVRAGDTAVSVLDYRLAYDRQIAQLSQQFGTRITREQAKALGVDEQVLAQLVAGAVLDEQARQLGLGLSRDKLAELTASDPAFQGPDGRFDRQQFTFVLNQIGMRPDDYIRNREQVAKRQQIVEAVSEGMAAPDAFLRAVALHRGEDRTIEYVALPRSLVEPVEAPSEAELQAWFEERQADYRAPEYRSLSLVKLEPEDIADPAVISDQQVRDYYEANAGRYTTPERRTIEQIVFTSEEAAQAAYESTRTGATFEDLVEAQDRTLEDARIGTFTREEVADPAVAEAAFALEVNEISRVVDGAFGPVLVRVTDIEPEDTRPLEAVREEIRGELALDEANRVLLDVYDAYEDARAGGATMREAAERLKLEMRSVEAVDRQGRRPDGTVIDDLPESQALLRDAFETEAGIENPPINIGSDGFLFYEVDSVTPARDRPLEEVRETVLADWRAQEVEARLAERAATYREQLAAGKSLDEIAAEIDQDKQVKRGVRRTADDPDLGRAGVQAVFGVPKGGTGTVQSPTGDARLLFTVTEVFEPAGAGPDAVPQDVRQTFARGFSDDLLDQLVTRLQDKYEVTINPGAIEQALSF